MFRFLKWSAWILGAFVVLLVAAVLAVQVFLSSDEVVRIVEREGRKLLGRKVSIERLELGLFKITASGVAVEGAGGKGEEAEAGGRPFIRLAEVDVLWNPSALLYRRVSVVQLTVRGGSFRVRRDARGKFDFRDVIEHLRRPAKNAEGSRAGGLKIPFLTPASAEAAPDAAGGGVGLGFGFVIHELDLYDVAGEVRFAAGDAAPAFAASCSLAHVEVDRIAPGEPLDVFVDGRCRRPGGPPLIRLKGDARADLGSLRYRASLDVPLLDASFMDALSPGGENYRLRSGTLAGSAKLAYAAGEPLAWEADLRGRAIRADFRANPGGKWRALRLPALKLKAKGRYAPTGGSAHVESLLFETPLANVRLTKPSFWSVAGKDEIHVEARVKDMAGVGGWVSAIAGFSLPWLKKGAAAEVTISAARDRRKTAGAVRAEAAARFDPVGLAAFLPFFSLDNRVTDVRGSAGGKARVVFVSGETERWDVDLQARSASARVRMNERKPWRDLRFEALALRSKGSFDERDGSARIDALEIELPFAAARLDKPARWNVSGRDEAALSVDVGDLASVADLLARLGLASLEGFPGGTRARLTAALSRNRKETSGFRAEADARFAALPIVPFVRLTPLPASVKKPAGRVSGALRVSLSPAGAVRWDADLAGKKIGAIAGKAPDGKPRAVSLDSAVLRTTGVRLPADGSFRVGRFELELPFARARLNRAATWGGKAGDAFSLTLDVTDSGAASRWLERLAAFPVPLAPGGEKMKILLSGKRGGKNGRGFSYEASASFDALRVAPLLELARLSPAPYRLAGEVAGKAALAYAPGRRIAWDLDLESGDLRAGAPASPARERRGARAGKVSLKTAGSYDLRSRSARLRSFDLSAPFGRVRMPKPARWNVKGRDAARLRWRVSSLGEAARLAGAVFGEPFSKLSAAGGADGWFAFWRNRKKMKAPAVGFSAAVKLRSLAHADYPNLRLAGEASGRMSGGVLKIRAPELRLSDAGRPGAPPDVVLRGLSASLGRAPLMRGELRAAGVQAKSLKVRYLHDAERRSNFASLFRRRKEKRSSGTGGGEEAGGGETGKAAPGVRRAAAPPPSGAGAARVRRAPGGAEREAGGPPLPVINVKKFEIQKLALHFEDRLEKDKPPIVWKIPDARVVVTNFDTRMAPNLRETRLALKTLGGETPSVSAKASLNPARMPPDVEGTFSLSGFDLREISSYARGVEGDSVGAALMRGTRITRGRLDFRTAYSLRDGQLDLKGRAKIVGLRLKPDGENPLSGIAMKIIERTALRPLKKKGDALSLDVSVSGRVDDPDFHLLDAVVEPVFANLFEQVASLGSDVTSALDEILGMAIEGVRKVLPGAKRGEDAGKEAAPRRGPFGTIGKGIGDVLEGLFGDGKKPGEKSE